MTISRGILAPRQRWTPSEEQLVRDLYPDVPCADIAALLERKPGSVYQAAQRLGLEKSAHFKASDTSGRIHRGRMLPSMIAHRFQPGLVPWNKGSHYAAGGRSAQTRFQLGARPHTELAVGSYRLVPSKNGRTYLEQKTSTTKGANHKRWTPVARLVWMAAHGAVPEGCFVVFKPGQHSSVLEQITLDKLECVNRQQNAQRNSRWHTDPELMQLYQLKGAITRQVNRIKEAHSHA